MPLTQRNDARLCIFFFMFLLFCVTHITAEKTEETEALSVTGTGKAKVYKPALLRTELRFGRYLDPEKVRVVNVKSNTGEDVEIIVGKDSRRARAGATHSFFVKSSDTEKTDDRAPKLADNVPKSQTKLADFPHTPLLLKQSELVRQQRDYQQRKAAAENRQIEQLTYKLKKAQHRLENQPLFEKTKSDSTGDRAARKLTFPIEDLEPQQQNQYFQPAYIPLNRAFPSNFSAPLDYMPWRRQWQPQEVHDLRTRNLRVVQDRLVPMLFAEYDFQPMLYTEQPNYNNEVYEKRNKRYYDTPFSSSPIAQQLVTKHNYMSTRAPNKFQQFQQVPASVVISATSSVNSPERFPNRNLPNKLSDPISTPLVQGPAVTVIEGVRVPDMPEDKVNTWRNARVLNNRLVPYPAGYTPPKVLVPTFDR